MRRNKIGIIGMGVVGSNLKKIFPEAVCYDKYKLPYTMTKNLINETDFCFICIPTPNNMDGSCNFSEVEEVVGWLESKNIIIKSTIPVGTTERLAKDFNKNICFSPEFAGATPSSHPENNFVILGGDKNVTTEVAQLYQEKFPGSFKIKQTDARTAELVKYMENSYLACKVVFCNQFFRIAEQFEINYNELRELWLLDSRINPSHTFVFKDHPYYDSKCLNKDIPALYQFCKENHYDAKFIKDIIERNEEFKNGS